MIKTSHAKNISDDPLRALPSITQPMAWKSKRRQSYYEANKAKFKAYYEANRERILKQVKAYRKANQEKITMFEKAYREKNHEKLQKIHRQYYIKNRDRIQDEYHLARNQ